MVPLASSSMSTGRFPGIIRREPVVFRGGSDEPSNNSLLRNLNLEALLRDGDAGLIPGSALPRPSSSSPSSSPACQTPGPSRLFLANPTWAHAGTAAAWTHRPWQRVGKRNSRPRLGKPGQGVGQSLGCPRPPGQNEPPAPSPDTGRQKDPQPENQRVVRSSCILSLAPERSRESFYPAPRCSAALWVPGPRLRTDGPPDNGPRAAARAGQAGALRDLATASRGRLRVELVAGSRGAARQTDKANGRRTDGGGKDGDADGGSALLAHPQWVGRVHEPLLSPSLLLHLGPLSASPGARPLLWAGLEGERGPGRRDLGSIQSQTLERGLASILTSRGPPSLHLPWSFSSLIRPSAPLTLLGPVNSTLTVSPDPGFLPHLRVQPQKPHPPTAAPPQAPLLLSPILANFLPNRKPLSFIPPHFRVSSAPKAFYLMWPRPRGHRRLWEGRGSAIRTSKKKNFSFLFCFSFQHDHQPIK